VFRLEDLTGGVGVVAFPSVYDKVPGLIEPDRILLVKGRVDLRGRELQLAAIDVSEPSLSGDGAPKVARSTDPVVVDVPAESCTQGLLDKLKETLASYPGSTAVVLRVLRSSGVTTLKVGDGYRVDGSEGLLSELRRLLGRDHVRVG
jgi:DNA polymerase-3 subunit alpha